MPAIDDAITIEQGATFVRQYVYTDSTGAPVNLTGYTAQAQVRTAVTETDADTPLADVTPTIDVPTATITVVFTAEETRAIPAGKRVWGLELTAAGGEPVIRLVQGVATVTAEVVK